MGSLWKCHVIGVSHDQRPTWRTRNRCCSRPKTPPLPRPPPTSSWRIGAAFWILGLCNNLPYVVMLSAARDLLEPRNGEERRNRSRHDCDPVGTGAVLLADVVPALVVKLLLPLVGPYLPNT
ncbi:battenin-like [Haemorhous mexicanus]|uniref:battenin-like n=1 Tax=Haemorhous mexicanus TaxID=30427 RepID=UPI0028BDCB76|nr:battenin-like [Haemorhous mexicanus]